MARTIYGAELFTSPTLETNYDGGRVLGKNSVEFHAGDPVKISSGLLDIAGATDAVYGVVVKDQVMASDNQTVAKVKPAVLPVDQDMEFLMGTNADLAATSVGVYYALISSTGAFQVDVSGGAMTGTSRIVVCTKVDPLNEGGSGAGSGLRQGLFKFVKLTNIREN